MMLCGRGRNPVTSRPSGFNAAARVSNKTLRPSAAPAPTRARSAYERPKPICFPLVTAIAIDPAGRHSRVSRCDAGRRRAAVPARPGRQGRPLLRHPAVAAGVDGAGGGRWDALRRAGRPALAVKDVRFSDIQQSQRVWTARVDVDASRCAARSGRFEVEFTRVKETGLDVTFSEAFSWRPGEIEVSTVFSEDEAVADYAIAYVAPCGCR